MILFPFRYAQGLTCFGDNQNIAPAFKVVQGVWQQRELQADEEVCLRTKKRRLQRNGLQRTADNEKVRFDGWYEWGKVMSMTGYWVSLA